MISEEVTKTIEKAYKTFSEAFLKRDASLAASAYDEHAIVFPPDSKPIQGKQAIESFWKGMIDSGVREAHLTTVELSGGGDYVHVRGTGVLKVQPQDGKPSERKIKYVVIWKHTANGWKIDWDIWNSSP